MEFIEIVWSAEHTNAHKRISLRFTTLEVVHINMQGTPKLAAGISSAYCWDS